MEVLSLPITSFKELEKSIQLLSIYPDRSFSQLDKAINLFTIYMKNNGQSDWSFYHHLLPNIIKWACDFDKIKPLPLLQSGNCGQISLSTVEIRTLLANAFFLNTLDLAFVFGCQRKFIGTLDFGIIYSDVYTGLSSVCIQRILCQLSYFASVSDVTEDRIITFDRLVMSNTPQWASDDTIISNDSVSVLTQSMEMSEGRGFVDFANADLHIGTIIPSMTQEEILFSTCPECFVGLLFCERFAVNEVMIIKNVQRFSTYSGYGSTFQWTGIDTEKRLLDVVVIDATMEEQYTSKMILRDLNKAWQAFSMCSGTITTGHWGCGAFGGNRVLKFLQQLCAATLAKVNLDYSTYGDSACAKKFEHILQLITSSNLRVRDIFALMIDFQTVTTTFDQYCLKKLENKPN